MSDDANDQSAPGQDSSPQPALPTLSVVRGQKGAKAKAERHGGHQTISRELYDMLADVYLKGERTVMGLARVGRIAEPTARKVINVGYPGKGWAPLKERATLHDKARQDAEKEAAVSQAKAQYDLRERARQESNGILRLGKAAYASLFKAFQSEAARTTFDSKARAAANALADEDTGPDPHRLILTGARLMQGFQVFRLLEEAGLALSNGDGTTGTVVDVPPGLASLSPEELDYVVERGALPPGRTPEQVFGIKPGKR